MALHALLIDKSSLAELVEKPSPADILPKNPLIPGDGAILYGVDGHRERERRSFRGR